MNEKLIVNYDPKEGYSIESMKTGLTYDLLEMRSYRGQASSDIVAIMIAEPTLGYIGLLDYCFGAEFLDDTLEYADRVITDYENGVSRPLSYISYDEEVLEVLARNHLKN